jgi:hypothetical protein
LKNQEGKIDILILIRFGSAWNALGIVNIISPIDRIKITYPKSNKK